MNPTFQQENNLIAESNKSQENGLSTYLTQQLIGIANEKMCQNLNFKQFRQQYPSLKKVKSTEELEVDFKQNQQILSSLNSNIDELFKKLSQLTNSMTSIKLPFQQCVDTNFNDQIKTKHVKSQNQLLTNPSQNNLSNEDQLQIQPPLNMKCFQTGKLLGYGKFGEVLQCKHLDSGMLFGLKKIFKSTVQKYNMHNQLLVELESQKRMNHPNIIKSYKSFTDNFHIFILMEYVNGIQLTKKFKSPQKYVSKVIKQVLSAIKYIHTQGVIHRDLKPENILVTDGQTVKICDFGWASIDGKQLDIICGTLDYLSPQMANKIPYDNKVDLWSVGVLTYQLMFGVAPFRQQTKAETMKKIMNIQLNFPSQIEASEECKDFIKGFLRLSKDRKDVEWGLDHNFIKLHDDETNYEIKEIKDIL